MSGDSEEFRRKLSDSYVNQIAVLKSMSQEKMMSGADNPRQYQIDEIAQLSGVNDEKECQRYLFILEGQKLVAPYPAGDFTSKVWHITDNGKKALKTINKVKIQ